MKFKTLIAIAAMVIALPAAAQAQWWQHHPGYLKAMSDLRSAYWLIQHREAHDPVANEEERRASNKTRDAYYELRNASIMDDKNIDDQPPADTTWYDHRGRLSHAKDLLNDARSRIEGEEEDPAARGLRHRAEKHIDAALEAIDAAEHAWHY